MSIVQVQIPLGVPPGGLFNVMAPSGALMTIVNPGLPAGAIMHVRAPVVAPQPIVMQQTVAAAPPPPARARA